MSDRQIPGPPCSVAEALAALPKSERDKLNSWLNNPRKTDKGVWEQLTKAGFRVGFQTVGRHRRGKGECKCR